MGYRFEVDDDDHILVIKTTGIWWRKRDVSVLKLRWNHQPSWETCIFDLPDGNCLGQTEVPFKHALLRFVDRTLFSRRRDQIDQQFKPVVNLPTATVVKK